MLYTRQPSVPPSYSGSLFRERGGADSAEKQTRRDAEEATEPADEVSSGEEVSSSEEMISEKATEKKKNLETPPHESEKKEEETVPVAARARERRPSILSRFGLDRLLGLDLEDLLILALAFILLVEDGENDLLPLLLVLFFTGK